jgi:hypothetical protein
MNFEFNSSNADVYIRRSSARCCEIASRGALPVLHNIVGAIRRRFGAGMFAWDAKMQRYTFSVNRLADVLCIIRARGIFSQAVPPSNADLPSRKANWPLDVDQPATEKAKWPDPEPPQCPNIAPIVARDDEMSPQAWAQAQGQTEQDKVHELQQKNTLERESAVDEEDRPVAQNARRVDYSTFHMRMLSSLPADYTVGITPEIAAKAIYEMTRKGVVMCLHCGISFDDMFAHTCSGRRAGPMEGRKEETNAHHSRRPRTNGGECTLCARELNPAHTGTVAHAMRVISYLVTCQ